MKYFLVIFFTSIFLTLQSQDVKLVFSDSVCISINSYSLLNPILGDPFVFQFSAQSQNTNYFSVKPVPDFNSLPSLFCKLEYKLETKSKLAPRFRLGSLQYANWMEGKGDYYSRY